MAIGLAYMFAIKLPINFYSPYKASSIIEFWRCWHITLSQFLRDYIYIPLGGGRCIKIRQLLNLSITMLLGGLWHGAGWTFIIWGGMHGVFLMINHVWRGVFFPHFDYGTRKWCIGRVLGTLLTFTCVVVAWVMFRASDVDAALHIYASMFGINGIQLPVSLSEFIPTNIVPLLGIEFVGMFYTGHFGDIYIGLPLLVVCGFIIWLMPNTTEIMQYYYSALNKPDILNYSIRFQWAMRYRWAVLTASMFGISILSFSRASEFLYFQF